MAKSFFKLNVRRALNDGTYPIVLCVGHGRDMYLPTGLSSSLEDWDKVSQLYTGKGAKSVNSVLRNLLVTVSARMLELRENGILEKLDNKQLRSMLKNLDADTPEQAPDHTIAQMFEMVIGTKNKRTAEIYASTVARLNQYCDISKVAFDDINKLWLDGFAASMADVSPNTKSIHMRNLRAVNNYAIDCGITKNYPFRRYQMPRQTTRKRSFSAEVIRNLASLPLGHNGIYRDLFMLTFYLLGINFVDLCGLTEIADGRVEYRRAKTGKPYSVKVEGEAAAIIDRLKGKNYLLYMLDGHKDYRSYYRQLRRGLEKVKEAYNAAYPEAPIAELSTYWARHSWATIAASLDIPKETIAAALGHDMGNSITAIYIDFDRRKVDEANRRVIDHVLGEQ